jgi:hypothetical protein
MTFSMVGGIFFAISLPFLFLDQRYTAFLLIASTVFGSTAVVQVSALGGASILFSQLCLLIFVLSILFDNDTQTAFFAVFYRSLATKWLTLFTIVIFASAIFYPIIFRGQTVVFPLRPLLRATEMLGPVSSNVTQALYGCGNLLSFAAVLAFVQLKNASEIIHRAIVFAAILHVVTGFIGLLSPYFGMADALEVMRTASYSLLANSEEQGFRRITGLFPEASSYANYAVVLLFYLLAYWIVSVGAIIELCVAIALILMLLLSTSSTAYASIFAAVVGIAGYFICNVARGSIYVRLLWIMASLYVLAVVVTSAIGFAPDAFFPITHLFDETVLGKLNSGSGIERSMWNRQALDNFIDTYGIGIGIGSSRTSSWILALMANLGVPGIVLFAGFFLSVIKARPQRGDATPDSIAIGKAAKAGCCGALVSASISGAVVDLGILFYIIAAVAASQSIRRAVAGRPIYITTATILR